MCPLCVGDVVSGGDSSKRRSSNFSKDDGDSSHQILKKMFDRRCVKYRKLGYEVGSMK